MATEKPDLYILGAGSSRNYSESTNHINGLKSPLNSDFFKMARRVIENTGMHSDPVFMEQVEALIRSVAPRFGGHSSLSLFDNPNLDLEGVMTLLDTEFRLFSPLAARLGQNESPQLRTLKDLLARTLDYALMGPPCKKHRSLAKSMKPGDIVLSLNYDLLLDNSLMHLKKMGDSGYAMNFFKVNSDGVWVSPSLEPSQVTLLKLHGSLNWIRCDLCGSLLLYRRRKQTLISGERFQCPRCLSGDTYAERVMIPPVQAKDYRDRDLAFLWVQADRAMKEFSKVICIGYSFSPLDFDMNTLMRRLRAKQNRTPEICFVSPDKTAQNRLRHLFGAKVMRRFHDLSSYLESDESA
jgi:hypothetical protein